MHTVFLLALAGCQSGIIVVSGDDAVVDDPLDDDVAGAELPCPVYSGLKWVGSRWRYVPAPEAAERDEVIVYEITDAYPGEDGWLVEMAYEDTWSSQNESGLRVGSIRYRCDAEGAWLVSVFTEYERAQPGHIESGWYETTYEGLLWVPPDLAVGDMWTMDITSTHSDHTGGEYTTELHNTYWAVASERVTVGAGTFSALRMAAYTTPGSEQYFFLARDPGWIRSGIYDLDRYHP